VRRAVQDRILLRLRVCARHVLQAPPTWTVFPRLHVRLVELASTRRSRPHRAPRAFQALPTPTVSRQAYVWLAETARTRLIWPHRARHVPQAGLTLTDWLTLLAFSVTPGTMPRNQQQHVLSARQVHMTMTLTLQHRATAMTLQHVLLAATALLARHHVPLASPDKPIWMVTQVVHVRLAELVRTRLRRPHRARHVLQARLILTGLHQLLAPTVQLGSTQPVLPEPAWTVQLAKSTTTRTQGQPVLHAPQASTAQQARTPLASTA